MPHNRYKCESCSKEWEYIGPYKELPCPECSSSTKPQIPKKVSPPSVFEVVDPSFNVKWRDNFQERAEKRNKSGTKKTAKEKSRTTGEDPSLFGWTEDDPRLI